MAASSLAPFRVEMAPSPTAQPPHTASVTGMRHGQETDALLPPLLPWPSPGWIREVGGKRPPPGVIEGRVSCPSLGIRPHPFPQLQG